MNEFRIIKLIKFIILKIKFLFKKGNNDKIIKESIVQENKKSYGISNTIYSDKILKANEKFYLMVIINSYKNELGYSEISIDEIKNAVNSKNNNTTVDIINRLEKKGYIKNIQLKKGLKARYVILKHINLKENINIDENLVNLEKKSNQIIKEDNYKDTSNENIDKNVKKENNDENINKFNNINSNIKCNYDKFNNKVVFEKNLITIDLIRKINQELKTNYNLLKFVVDKNDVLSNEIESYLEDKK